jgi:hypothetical protein
VLEESILRQRREERTVKSHGRRKMAPPDILVIFLGNGEPFDLCHMNIHI